MTTAANVINESTEVLEVQGNKLTETLKSIFAAGRFNRIIISSANGKTLLDVPYGAGLTVTALISYLLPPVAISAPVLMLMGQLKIEVLREKAEEESTLPEVEVKEVATTSEQPESDQLQDIAGIGKVFAGRLHEAGIHTFSQLVAETPERISEIVSSKEKSVPTSETQEWITEARQLSERPL